ncbi:PilN domain-containing protein, partial [Noviherbaspirillum sp.]|uniref:PilN domain-containing protein n=1 Tax=Noviherbaspirillum sp. TaxID=1926288 RepID=UPI002FE3BD5A
MSQQINLFNPIFLKQKKYFSAVTMAQALGLILLGSALLSAYTNYRVTELAREADATTAQLASAQAQLNKLNAEFGPRQKSALIEQQTKAAELEVAELKQVVDFLTRGEFGNTNGYSEYMRAFSRQIVPDLWLTGFAISGAGSEIALQGRALKAELVPAYISKLKRETVLQGKSFAALE